MTRRGWVAVGGLVLLAAGLLLGLWPHSAGALACGSPFQPSGDGLVSDLLGETSGAYEACRDALGSLRLVGIGLVVAGAGLALRALLAGRKATTAG